MQSKKFSDPIFTSHAGKNSERKLKVKPFTIIAAGFFAVIAVVQLVRFLFSWEVTVNGVMIPVWASGIASVVAAGLAVMLWREARR